MLPHIEVPSSQHAFIRVSAFFLQPLETVRVQYGAFRMHLETGKKEVTHPWDSTRTRTTGEATAACLAVALSDYRCHRRARPIAACSGTLRRFGGTCRRLLVQTGFIRVAK